MKSDASANVLTKRLRDACRDERPPTKQLCADAAAELDRLARELAEVRGRDTKARIGAVIDQKLAARAERAEAELARARELLSRACPHLPPARAGLADEMRAFLAAAKGKK